ncbi:TadE family type IV pilus minor pilin [Streptomyces sp. NPDC055055]
MTVEAAMVLPVLALFTVTLLWALAAAAAQIRCVDAARAGARAAARSEPPASAEAAARAAAPEGSRVSVTRDGDLWRVAVEVAAPGPGGMGITLRAGAAALAEDTLGAPPEDAPPEDVPPAGPPPAGPPPAGPPPAGPPPAGPAQAGEPPGVGGAE